MMGRGHHAVGHFCDYSARVFVFFLAALLGPPAWAWDTAPFGAEGGLDQTDWRSTYAQMPHLSDGEVVVQGNEHAELSALALVAIGAEKLVDPDAMPEVVDLNASLFRREKLRGTPTFARANGEKAADDALERRILPPVASFSGLPDFSYTLYDWINKNRLCPLAEDLPQREEMCHNYKGWLGAGLNASHFGHQAAETYRHLHAVALGHARRAREMRERLARRPGALDKWRAAVVEAEYLALAYEGIAQHFLADRWATAHMWNRWSSGSPDDLPTTDLYTNQLVGYLSGLMHGMESVLHLKVGNYLGLKQFQGRAIAERLRSDPLATPYITYEKKGEAYRIIDLQPAIWKHEKDSAPGYPGIGDYGVKSLLEGQFGGMRYGFVNKEPLPVAEQRREMLACMEGSWADVIRALGSKNQGTWGALEIALRTDAPTIEGRDDECLDTWVTNRSMMLAWPFSRPTEWSILGRSVVGTAKALDVAAGAGQSIVEGVEWLTNSKLGGKQLTIGRAAAAEIVRLSALLWAEGRKRPGGIYLARGGLGALHLDPKPGLLKKITNWFSSKPAEEPKAVFPMGGDFDEPSYLEPEDWRELPKLDRVTGRDRRSIFGFFSRAGVTVLAEDYTRLFSRIRGSDDPVEQQACEFIADLYYDGTPRDYEGPKSERRHLGQREVPGLAMILNPQLAELDLPLQLSPAYVDMPEDRSSDGITLASVERWCARHPVLDFLPEPEQRNRHIVAIIREVGESLRLTGADLGEEPGRLTFDCGHEDAHELAIESWGPTAIRASLDSTSAGLHRLCLDRADGVRSVGYYLVQVDYRAPSLTNVSIHQDGQLVMSSDGNRNEPIRPGKASFYLRFDTRMDLSSTPSVHIEGPGLLAVPGGKWVDNYTWQFDLSVPMDAPQGNYRLVVAARALSGLELDAAPAVPGAQPDRDHGFEIGKYIPSIGRLEGCWSHFKSPWAVETLPGGETRLLEEGRVRVTLETLSARQERIVVGYRLPAPMGSGVHELPPWAPPGSEELCDMVDWNRPALRCYEWVTNPDGMTTQVWRWHTIRPGRPWRRIWAWKYLEKGGVEKIVGDTLNESDPVPSLTLISDSSEEDPAPGIDDDLGVYVDEGSIVIDGLGEFYRGDSEVTRLYYGRDIPSVVEPPRPNVTIVEGMLPKVDFEHAYPDLQSDQELVDYFAGMPVIERAKARLRDSRVIGTDGQERQMLRDGEQVQVEATADWGCPATTERSYAMVSFPGSPRSQRIELMETGPDTNRFLGPSQPLTVNLAAGTRAGTFIVEIPTLLEQQVAPGYGFLKGMPGARSPAVARAMNRGRKVLRVVESSKPVSPPAPTISHTSWTVEARPRGGGRLPEVEILAYRLDEKGGDVRLRIYRYELNYAHGERGTFWAVRRGIPELVEDVSAPAGPKADALRARFGKGVPLDDVPNLVHKALGGKARPLNDAWKDRLAKDAGLQGGDGKASSVAAASSQITGTGGKSTSNRGAYSYNGPPYRAEGVMRLGGNKQMIPIVLYEAPGRRRIEMKVGRATVVDIVREDLGITWHIAPDGATFIESKIPKGARWEKELIGEQVIKGRKLSKYALRNTAAGWKGTFWIDDRGIPVLSRVEADVNGRKQVTETELTKVTIGRVDPKLFERPSP